MIYTSYYRGEIRGESISISLYPPKNWKGRHLPLFAPTPELLKWWKSSAQDAEAELEYERQFLVILQSRQQLIDLWVRKQQSSADITLCCFEKTGDFCHRHIVGREVVERSLPELWGGEVATANQVSTIGTQNRSRLTPTELNKGNGLTDTLKCTSTVLQQFYKRNITESITPQASIGKGAAAQSILVATEQPTNETLGTHNDSIPLLCHLRKTIIGAKL